jgi:CBS domain-containing protein
MTKQKKRLTVAELMSPNVISLRPDDRVSQAVREMTLAGVRHLPIVEHGRIVGIVSSHDLAAVLDAPDDAALRTLMSSDVVSVLPDAPAVEAVGLMIDAKYGALPVVTNGGELVGIITATDFLAVAQHALLGEPIEREPGEI